MSGLGFQRKKTPAVGIDRYDCSDALSGGDLARVDHDQQLHQVVVHLPAATLEVEVNIEKVYKMVNPPARCRRPLLSRFHQSQRWSRHSQTSWPPHWRG